MTRSRETIGKPSLPSTPESERIVETGRQMLKAVLKHRDADLGSVAAMLYRMNPERAEGFLDSILEIDPQSSDDQKTAQLLELLKRHSPNSYIHSKDASEILESIVAHPPGDSVLGSVRLAPLAKAILRHDFGKLGMRESTLNQSHRQFNDSENREKEGHPLLGTLILKALKFKDPLSSRIALTHHLRYETAQDGHLEIVGYPKADFLDYCGKNGLSSGLTPEDLISSFVDVYSALTDISRPSNLFGTNDPKLPLAERSRRSVARMDEVFFKDPYYQQGGGAPLFRSFKKAVLEIDSHSERLAA